MKHYALITGGGSGIGYEFADLLAARGWNLVLVGRGQEKLQQAADQLHARHADCDVRLISRDLALPGEPERVAAECLQRELPVKMLINNAGRGLFGPLSGQDPGQLLQMLRLNIEALTVLSQRLAGSLDYLLNVGSMAGRLPMPRYAAYGASKSYVREFTLALRQELRAAAARDSRPAPKVAVLEPGYVQTEFDVNAGVADRRYLKFSKFNAMTARQVAEIGLKGLLAGKALIVPGWRNRLMLFFVHFMPKTLAARVVWRGFSALIE
ncbi:MAG: SDR family NAD(P)-dependent oxidoreductase [Spirochaetota bacterium]